MVTDDKALLEVVKEGVVPGLPKGAIHVAMGTHSVAAIREVDAVHDKPGKCSSARRCSAVPRPPPRAKSASWPAGPKDAVAKVAPLFEVIGRRTFHGGREARRRVGREAREQHDDRLRDRGDGRGFSLVRKYGVDPATFYDVMTDGLFSAPAYKVYGNIIVKQAYATAGFTTTLGLKDTNLAMAAALAANVPLPSLNVYRDRLLGAIAHGEAEQDWAVMARDQARASGLE